MKDVNDPTVAKLLEILDSKYLKTKYERVGDVIEEMFAMKESNEKDTAKFFGKVKTLSTKIKDEKIGDTVNLMLLVMMIKKGKSSGLLTEYKSMELKKRITNEKGEIAADNDTIMDRVEEEY